VKACFFFLRSQLLLHNKIIRHQPVIVSSYTFAFPVGVELGFELNLITYVARHSFATILVRSGASLAFASQSLGHTNVLTTQKYFAGFDLEAQAHYTKALTNFF